MPHAQSIAVASHARATASSRTQRRALHLVRVLLVALYLISVARFYTPGAGFTRLIMFSAADHHLEVAAVQKAPHVHGAETGGYDGQYYAQLAVDPLLNDPALDRAMDKAPYRARRILLPWIAHLAGLGRPSWVLQAYALQNVVSWLLFAWWLHRRLPSADLKSLLVWAGCLFSHGLLISTRLALLDGPSVLLCVLAVSAVERSRPLVAAAVAGVSGLARETNLLTALAVPGPWPPSGRQSLRYAGRVCLVVAPLLLWTDYLRSIYRSAALAGSGDLLNVPLAAYLRCWKMSWLGVLTYGAHAPQWAGVLALTAVTVQAGFLAARIRWRNPWWRVAVGYVVMMLLLHGSVWEGNPGAFTRVLLPMQIAFNLLVIDSPAFWPLFVLGNLGALPGLKALQVPLFSRLF